MANKTGNSPWILDTTHASNSFAPYPNNPVWVTAFAFQDYGAAGNTATIEDVRGVVWAADGHDDLSPVVINFSPPQEFIGLKLTALDSGTVQVFVL